MPRGKNKKPRKERRDSDRQARQSAEMIAEFVELMACPLNTANELAETVSEHEDVARRAAKIAYAADLVHGGQPGERSVQLSALLGPLRAELERHSEALQPMLARLVAIAEDASDHDDIDHEQVFERLKPWLEANLGDALEEALEKT
ncbi:MAG: hypothetical protein ACTHU0_10650 [Kofleriaceae bacterium]